MDLELQQAIQDAVNEHSRDQLIVFLGAMQPERLALSAKTVTTGDPSYAGPLAGVSLRLAVFHILEEPVKKLIAPKTWQKNVAVIELACDSNELRTAIDLVIDCRTHSLTI